MKSLLQRQRQLRQTRIRARVRGTDTRPRLHVYRSSRYTYAQIINDVQGKTLVAASSKDIKEKATKTQAAAAIGTLLAAKAKKAKITQVSFDRGYHKYHGRLRALAEAVRTGGLEM